MVPSPVTCLKVQASTLWHRSRLAHPPARESIKAHVCSRHTTWVCVAGVGVWVTCIGVARNASISPGHSTDGHGIMWHCIAECMSIFTMYLGRCVRSPIIALHAQKSITGIYFPLQHATPNAPKLQIRVKQILARQCEMSRFARPYIALSSHS